MTICSTGSKEKSIFDLSASHRGTQKGSSLLNISLILMLVIVHWFNFIYQIVFNCKIKFLLFFQSNEQKEVLQYWAGVLKHLNTSSVKICNPQKVLFKPPKCYIFVEVPKFYFALTWLSRHGSV